MKKSSIRDELDQIARGNNGVIRPFDVIEFAKNPKTILHGKFIWDNSKAAHQYRLWQARHIINNVYVNISDNGDTRKVRVYVSLTPDRGDGYRQMSNVMVNTKQRNQMLEDARRDFTALKDKYESLVELSGIWREVAKAFK